MPTMKRCLAQLSIAVAGRPTEHLWPGLEVNVDRELAPGYTLKQAIAGREDAFEDLAPTVPTPATKRTAPLPALKE